MACQSDFDRVNSQIALGWVCPDTNKLFLPSQYLQIGYRHQSDSTYCVRTPGNNFYQANTFRSAINTILIRLSVSGHPAIIYTRPIPSDRVNAWIALGWMCPDTWKLFQAGQCLQIGNKPPIWVRTPVNYFNWANAFRSAINTNPTRLNVSGQL